MRSSNADETWSAGALWFALEHPTAAGHFPGNPIIPGALLLEHTLRAIDGEAPSALPREIRHAKFHRPVRPGERVTLRWQRLADGEVRFEMTTDESDDPVLTGAVKAPGK